MCACTNPPAAWTCHEGGGHVQVLPACVCPGLSVVGAEPNLPGVRFSFSTWGWAVEGGTNAVRIAPGMSLPPHPCHMARWPSTFGAFVVLEGGLCPTEELASTELILNRK